MSTTGSIAVDAKGGPDCYFGFFGHSCSNGVAATLNMAILSASLVGRSYPYFFLCLVSTPTGSTSTRLLDPVCHGVQFSFFISLNSTEQTVHNNSIPRSYLQTGKTKVHPPEESIMAAIESRPKRCAPAKKTNQSRSCAPACFKVKRYSVDQSDELSHGTVLGRNCCYNTNSQMGVNPNLQMSCLLVSCVGDFDAATKQPSFSWLFLSWWSTGAADSPPVRNTNQPYVRAFKA